MLPGVWNSRHQTRKGAIMTTEEARTAKDELESLIFRQIHRFETDTGLTVRGIAVDRNEYHNGECRKTLLREVRVTVQL